MNQTQEQTQIEIEDLEATEDQVGGVAAGDTAGGAGTGAVAGDTTMCGW